jgi:hypothetical protein
MKMNIWIPFKRLSYVGEEMFITCMIGQWKHLLDATHDTMQTYNKMYSNFKVQVKWGVGEFHPTKPKYSHLFQTNVARFSPLGRKPALVFSPVVRITMRTFFTILIGDDNCLMRTAYWKSPRFSLGIKFKNQISSHILKKV